MLTTAFQSDSSGFVSLLTYMSIVWAYLCDILILNEKIDTIEFFAALTILIVAVSVAYYKARKTWLEQRKAKE